MFKLRLLWQARTKGSKAWSTAGSFSVAAVGDKLLAVHLKAKQAFAGTLLFGRAARQRSQWGMSEHLKVNRQQEIPFDGVLGHRAHFLR